MTTGTILLSVFIALIIGMVIPIVYYEKNERKFIDALDEQKEFLYLSTVVHLIKQVGISSVSIDIIKNAKFTTVKNEYDICESDYSKGYNDGYNKGYAEATIKCIDDFEIKFSHFKNQIEFLRAKIQEKEKEKTEDNPNHDSIPSRKIKASDIIDPSVREEIRNVSESVTNLNEQLEKLKTLLK